MKLMIHGGFFSESATNHKIKLAKQASLKNVAEMALAYLKEHTALQTVVYATSILEDDELFNAGTGSQIQSDGKIRLSASLMDGKTQRFSGVINILDVKNPVQVAEKLLSLEDRVLSGDNATAFARDYGFDYYNPETPLRRADYDKKLTDSIRMGTVGCVALDADGNLAAATSTGGKGFEIPGRVSDSATVAGNYADDFAAISCTGVGEDITSAAISAKVATRVADGFSLADAGKKTLDEMKPYNGFAGLISLSSKGEIFHADTHPYMVWALADENGVQCFE